MKAPWDPRLRDEPAWPAGEGPFLFLIDASSELERQILEDWIDRNRPDGVRADWVRIPQTRRRRRRPRLDPHLEARLRQEDDPIMVPLRIAWLAREYDGRRRVSLRDVLVFGDPRDPNLLRQRYLRTFHPDRLRILQAAPATKTEMEKRWQDPTGRGPVDGTTLAEFVALKAWLALERSERALRGARYKVPKFLREDLFWSRGFQQGVARLAIQEGKTLKWMQHRCSRYLKEIAATHSPGTPVGASGTRRPLQVTRCRDAVSPVTLICIRSTDESTNRTVPPPAGSSPRTYHGSIAARSSRCTS